MEDSDDGWMDQDIISMRLKLIWRWRSILVEQHYLMKIETYDWQLVIRINLTEIKSDVSR